MCMKKNHRSRQKKLTRARFGNARAPIKEKSERLRLKEGKGGNRCFCLRKRATAMREQEAATTRGTV